MSQVSVPKVTISWDDWHPDSEPEDDVLLSETKKDNPRDRIAGLTKGELALLAAYWLNQGLEDEFFIFAYQCFGRSDLRRIDYDYARLDRIGRLLGEERMSKIREEVEAQFAERVGDDAWYAFKYGEAEDRKRFQDLIQTKLDLSFKPDDVRKKQKEG